MTKNNTITEQFLSTTKRTVGVQLDLAAGTIRYWLNSRVLKKQKTKELKRPGLTWYPFIRLQEANIPAILNPFCRLPYGDNQAPKFRKKLPQSLTNHNLSHGRVTFLKNKFEGKYLLINLPNKPDGELETHVRQLAQGADSLIASFTLIPEPQDKSQRACILTFDDAKKAQEWIEKTAKKELNLLNDEAIARLILSDLTTS